MKAKNLSYVLLVLFCLASCSSENDAPVNDAEVIVSLEREYHARSVAYDATAKGGPDLSALPTVSASEAASILEVLSKHTNEEGTHSVESTEGYPGQTFLSVNATTQVATNHRFTISLELISYADDGSLYYKGYSASSSSYLYKWHTKGFSLSTGTDGNYNFECSSFLYFRIEGETGGYLEVPVKVTGMYVPTTHSASFTYVL